MYGGHIGFNYNITIDDPTFPPFWENEYHKFDPDEEPDGPGPLRITPEFRIPIGPPKVRICSEGTPVPRTTR